MGLAAIADVAAFADVAGAVAAVAASLLSVTGAHEEAEGPALPQLLLLIEPCSVVGRF